VHGGRPSRRNKVCYGASTGYRRRAKRTGPQADWQLALAFDLSSLIGIEREWLQKSAGLRTRTLVGTGGALFVIVSKYGFSDVLGNHVILDPSRVAAQIASGIGLHRRRADFRPRRPCQRSDYRSDRLDHGSRAGQRALDGVIEVSAMDLARSGD
jgi:hypothetical protein